MASIAERLDEMLAPWNKLDSPGCQITAIRNGNIIYQGSRGIANLEWAMPITPATLFEVASVAKQFTAMAIALLVAEGQLALDDEVRKYLPELPVFRKPVTLSHLISHSSGLINLWELLVLAGWTTDIRVTTEAVVRLAGLQPDLLFDPGAIYHYSNTGYSLLAAIVERVSGHSFSRFCDERIFQPLGMRATHFCSDPTAIVQNRAQAYAPAADGSFYRLEASYGTCGAAKLFTNADDFVRWDQNLYSGAVGGQAVVDRMQVEGQRNDGQPIGYAFGFNVRDYEGYRMLNHSGADAGYRCHYLRLPELCFSVIVLGNLSSLDTAELAMQTARICLTDTPARKIQTQPGAKHIEAHTAETQSAAHSLSRWAGIYYNADTSRYLRLEMRGETLVEWKGPGFELIPRDEHRFSSPIAPERQLIFKRTADETGVQLQEVLAGVGTTIYEAIHAYAPELRKLNEYVGSYGCSELNTQYSVMFRQGRLWLKLGNFAQGELAPIFPDGFNYDNSELSGIPFRFDVVFFREAAGIVTGFDLFSESVRNMRFLRVGTLGAEDR